MKTTVLSLSKKWIAAGMLLTSGSLLAQTHRERVYANVQESSTAGVNVGTPITNAGNAVDGTTTTYSTLSLGIGLAAQVYQYLEFTDGSGNPVTVSAGDTIFVKFSTPSSVLSALSGVIIGTFTNLHSTTVPIIGTTTWSATTTPVSTGSSLLNLLSGSGTNDVAIVAPSACNGVYVELNGGLASVALSSNVYGAYMYNDAVSGDAGCPKPVDVLSGVQATAGLGVANVTSSVSDDTNAIDGDPTTAATLNIGVQVASEAYLTAELNTPAKAGDSVKILIQDNNGSLLSISALTNFKIVTYNGSTVIDTLQLNSTLLNISLLSGASGVDILKIAAPHAFDRVSIIFGGLAGVLSSTNIYEISTTTPAPIVDASSSHVDKYVYQNDNFTLTATADATSDPIVWHDATGNLVSNASTSSIGTFNFYALSSRDGCIESSDSSEVTLHVIAAGTSHAPGDGAVGTSYTDSVTVAQPASALPNTPEYKYTTDVNTLPPGLTLDSTTGVISGTPTTAGTYNFTVHVVDTNNQDESGNDLVVGNYDESITISSALAVNLKSFGAALDAQENVVLTWTTASEQNEAKFNVQSSSDGQSFSTIGSVKASGTTSDAHTYTYTDKSAAGLIYYRLGEIDDAGNVIYSNVINIDNGKQKAVITISPNPATTKITIGGNVAQVNIYDAGGRLVLTDKQSQIDVSKLSRGIYFVTVQQQDGSIVKTKFIKD